MSTTDISEIREALATRLKEISAFNGQAYAYVPDTIEPPGVVVVPGTFVPGDTKAAIQYDKTMGRGSNDYIFTLMVVVSAVSDKHSQKKLDKFLAVKGDHSVKAKLEEDDTLGGLVFFAHLDRCIQYGKLSWNNNQFFGAQLIVEVSAG